MNHWRCSRVDNADQRLDKVVDPEFMFIEFMIVECIVKENVCWKQNNATIAELQNYAI